MYVHSRSTNRIILLSYLSNKSHANSYHSRNFASLWSITLMAENISKICLHVILTVHEQLWLADKKYGRLWIKYEIIYIVYFHAQKPVCKSSWKFSTHRLGLHDKSVPGPTWKRTVLLNPSVVISLKFHFLTMYLLMYTHTKVSQAGILSVIYIGFSLVKTR